MWTIILCKACSNFTHKWPSQWSRKKTLTYSIIIIILHLHAKWMLYPSYNQWFKSECESTVTFIQYSKSESRASALDLLSTLSEINYINLPVSNYLISFLSLNPYFDNSFLISFLSWNSYFDNSQHNTSWHINQDSTQRMILSCSTSTALDELVRVKVSAYKLLGVMSTMPSIYQVFICSLSSL